MDLYSLKGKRVWVAGHNGMVGSALVQRLEREDCTILTAERRHVNLCRQSDVESWMTKEKPDAIFLAAAKVGGIYANDTFPAEFIYENLMIEANIIHASHINNVEKLLFLGSSCIYPQMANQPITEDSLLTSPLEPTNEWYAIAKIAGIKLCQAYRKQYGRDFISAMPTNLYGPGDNYHPQNSHVVPALIRRIHQAKTTNADEISVWGSGKPKREFLHVSDAADAMVFLMKNYSDHEHVNVGTGIDITIKELVAKISAVIGYRGNVNYDTSKPDGTPRKLLDVGKLNKIGWTTSIELDAGLEDVYKCFLDEHVKS